MEKEQLEKYSKFYREINGWGQWSEEERKELLLIIKNPNTPMDTLYYEFYHAFNCDDWEIIKEISKNPSTGIDTLKAIYISLEHSPNSEELYDEIKRHKLYSDDFEQSIDSWEDKRLAKSQIDKAIMLRNVWLNA